MIIWKNPLSLQKNGTVTQSSGIKPKNDPCKIFIKIEEDYAEKAYILCKKIERNLTKIYGIENRGKRKNYCLHYKYWLYEMIMGIYRSESDKKYFSSIVKKLMQLRTSILDGYIDYSCQYHFHHDNFKDLEEKVEKKYLHDYFNNFDFIEKTIKICNQSKYYQYNKYLSNIINLYKKYKQNECYDYDFDYWVNQCDDFFNVENKYNPILL